MTVTAIMPVRMINLVAPLPHKGIAMRITDTAGAPGRSGAVSRLGDRPGDLDSATTTPPTRVTPGIRTSTTATRTTTTSTTTAAPGPSADDHRHLADFTFTDLVEAYLSCRRTLRRRTYRDALQRIATLQAEDLHQTSNSYFGLLRQTTHSHADRARLANLLRHRGHTIAGDITKTFRTTHTGDHP